MNLQDQMNRRNFYFIGPATFEDDFDYVFTGIAVEELRNGVLD